MACGGTAREKSDNLDRCSVRGGSASQAMHRETRLMAQPYERSKWLAYGVLAFGAFALVAGGGLRIMPSAAEDARVIPAPTFEEKAFEAPLAIAVLAGGCFWGVQGV